MRFTKRFTYRYLSLAGLSLWLSGAAHGLLAAEPPSRIAGEIKDDETFTLTGNTRPILARAQDQGEVSSSLALPRVTIHFKQSSQQKEDLDQLLRQQQAFGSPQFHKFLTPEQYGERFGMNSKDTAKVTAWLENEGFSDIQVARSKTFVSFSGTAGLAEMAFHTSIHRYSYNGETHYANASDPLLPKALERVVESIRGLNDFRRRPLGVRRFRPRFTSSISGNHFLAPDDFATIYDIQPLYQAGFDGTGVKIAVVGQSDIQLSDIQAFRTAAGLPANNPTIIVDGKDPGIQSSSGDESESDLDVEWAGGIAKNATIVFVTATDVLTSITYAIDNNVAPVLSVTYGLCESELGQAEEATEASQYQQANAQGMTVSAAAGDSGAADCDTGYPAKMGLAVDVPAALPYVTGLGGTTLNEGSGTYWSTTNNSYAGSALSYIPEVAWNDTNATDGLDASGGGMSIYNSKPSWQTGKGVPSDGARDVPDLAVAASPNHDGYLICSGGDCVNGFRDKNQDLDVIGGTSAAAPSFAAILALMVQMYGPQGNINPHLYALAASSSNVFHDITSGNNIVPCQTGTPDCTTGSFGYSAGPGYDQVTGWGSVDAFNFVNQWAGDVASPVGASQGPLVFVPITPCRVADTRNPDGPFGGPEMGGDSTREFVIPESSCSIPTSAAAYALNVTVVPSGPLGYLSIWPSGQGRPYVSTLNSDGRVKANAAIVPAGNNGAINVYVTNPTQVILDISGYFVPASSSGLQFFPLTACRIADTRAATGPLGGPSLVAGQSRDFPVLSSACNVPSTAQAYSLNFTVIPPGWVYFFAAWPTGQAQPFTSILNANPSAVTANAALLPAGTNGSITAFASNNTDLVIDINGYFAPAATGGSNFYTLTPCRVIDTRNPPGSTPFSGTLAVDVATSGCGAPATATAYALNATVVPPGPLWFLALWPAGQNQPVVSTLNTNSNTVTSNMAIVPASNGSIDAFATDPTYLILDIAGYFVP